MYTSKVCPMNYNRNEIVYYRDMAEYLTNLPAFDGLSFSEHSYYDISMCKLITNIIGRMQKSGQ